MHSNRNLFFCHVAWPHVWQHLLETSFWPLCNHMTRPRYYHMTRPRFHNIRHQRAVASNTLSTQNDQPRSALWRCDFRTGSTEHDFFLTEICWVVGPTSFSARPNKRHGRDPLVNWCSQRTDSVTQWGSLESGSHGDLRSTLRSGTTDIFKVKSRFEKDIGPAALAQNKVAFSPLAHQLGR